VSSVRWPAYFAIAGFVTAGLGIAQCLASHRAAHRSLPAVISGVLPRVLIEAQADDAGYYERLRARLHWVKARMGRDTMLTPDLDSRMLLAKSAARRAGLAEVGLSFTDVYGLIHAETSWVPRAGSSRDGTPNLGIAQFEPATARALGVQDPEDAVEAVHAAALHMKEAALWSNDRLRGLKLGKAERAEKLREGISIYYNLSTHARNEWNGRNTARLPIETRRHIVNARLGAQEAAAFDAQLRASQYARDREGVTASGSGHDS
jgi:hypothetical protein